MNFLQTIARDKGGIEYANGRLYNLQKRALEMIDAFPNSPYIKALKEYVNYVVDRSK